MNLKLSRYTPPGFRLHIEIGLYVVGMIFSILYSFSFFLTFSVAKGMLYYNGNLIEDAVMPDFIELLDTSLMGFLLLALCMLSFIIVHYAYYQQDSKSIYLMRRLSDPFELHRRNLTLPILLAVSCLLAAFLLLLIYFAFYMHETPKACIRPDQWQKIWRELL